jgi:ferredoxin-NADP reductase
MQLSDFRGLLKSRSYALRNRYEAEDGCMVFEFTAHQETHWLPGQHGIFTIPKAVVTGQKWRAFSVASIPEEKVIKIATKISDTPSSFKTALRKLKPGQEIKMRGPFGWFHFQDEVSPVVMIAGGVGITPFLALLKELEKGSQREVTLIYSARESYLFKADIDTIADKNANINLVYLHTKEELSATVQAYANQIGNQAYYFVSGSPGMIKSVQQMLKAKNVNRSRIINDSFRGY